MSSTSVLSLRVLDVHVYAIKRKARGLGGDVICVFSPQSKFRSRRIVKVKIPSSFEENFIKWIMKKYPKVRIDKL